jgi:antitoxin component of MazEF toxin-antitoxin module
VYTPGGTARAAVKKRGNGAEVRILAGILAEARLVLNEELDVRKEAARIIIEAMRRKS